MMIKGTEGTITYDANEQYILKQPEKCHPCSITFQAYLMASVRLPKPTSVAKNLAFAGSNLIATVNVLKIVLRRESTSFRSTLSQGGLMEKEEIR